MYTNFPTTPQPSPGIVNSFVNDVSWPKTNDNDLVKSSTPQQNQNHLELFKRHYDNKSDSDTDSERSSNGSTSPSPIDSTSHNTITNNHTTDDTTKAAPSMSSPSSPLKKHATIVNKGEFESERHFYPRVLNATIHPLVASFLQLGNERIIARYTHLNPQIKVQKLVECLSYQPKHFRWAGSDLFNVTTASGQRQMIIVETNSCPSGQKSMPLLSETEEFGGYRVVLESAFQETLEKADPSLGDLAVICDKNYMEASGYAAVLAEISREKVWYVEYHINDDDPPVKWVDRVLYIRDANGEWHSIRACFRYVTQKPWSRIPLNTRTLVMNQIISCLAGGRNKMLAARAYEFYNAELSDSGLAVRMPETINNVTKSEIPLWLHSMGGHAVLKEPYSNAGQGVYTITTPQELQHFLDQDHHYDKFIVQSLVGNASWSSMTRAGRFYHVGTIPNRRNHTYVTDLRMMVTANKDGFRPVCLYSRRARKPLLGNLQDDPSRTSWEMLGTNLSVKGPDGRWSSEPERLLLMDRKDFNQLGLGVDDLIDAYVQTCLSVIAIDKMCMRLMPEE
ncbi:11669_t:CDS:2, partial [Ambispora leptoticha]